MLHYGDGLTEKILMGCAKVLARDVEDVLEDLGTHLVSHPTTEPLRRCFGLVGSILLIFCTRLMNCLIARGLLLLIWKCRC